MRGCAEPLSGLGRCRCGAAALAHGGRHGDILLTSRTLIHDKVKQILYAGDEYDAVKMFDSTEYTRAKRMFDDYSSQPNADDIVSERAETATEQIEEVQG